MSIKYVAHDMSHSHCHKFECVQQPDVSVYNKSLNAPCYEGNLKVLTYVVNV